MNIIHLGDNSEPSTQIASKALSLYGEFDIASVPLS